MAFKRTCNNWIKRDTNSWLKYSFPTRGGFQFPKINQIKLNSSISQIIMFEFH